MKYIFANWKMYLDAEESISLALALQTLHITDHVECAVFPTLLSFREVKHILDTSPVSIGVQNVNWVPKGAYTGEVSAALACEAGAKYSLIGHSERRYLCNESDTEIVKKVQACDDVGLVPVVCIGETKEDLDAGKRSYRLKKQIDSVLAGRDNQQPLIFAYEPVWAISSSTESSPCLPADADDVVGFIKQEIKKYTDEFIPVLYGGSVNEVNASEYLSIPSGDGLLIGSASTHIDSFSKILAQALDLE